MKNFTRLVAAAAVALATSAAHAMVPNFISPIAAETSAPIAYPGSNNDPAFLIDGSIDYNQYLVVGVPAGVAFTGPYTIRFDLGGNFDLTAMNLWNNAGHIGNDGEGIRNFDLELRNAAQGLVATFSFTADDGLAPQPFDFAASGIRFADLVIRSNHQENSASLRGYAALYEVNFNGVAAVPEPHAYALLLAGLSLVGWGARRGRRGKGQH